MIVNDYYIPLIQNDEPYLPLYGGAGCFHANQLVITDKGSVPISQVKIGDNILSYNLETGQKEYKPVVKLWKYTNNKRILRVNLKNGTFIIATEDHKFLYGGSWKSLREIVSYWYDRNMENNTRI